MKKITLASLSIFFVVLIVALIGNKFPQGEKILAQRSISTPSSSIKSEQINTGNTSYVDITKSDKAKTHQINPPNIDINNVVFELSKPLNGSFTQKKIARHNSPDDCYIVINNNVYDVSSYISYHPGGTNTIISRCGKEVTGIFASIHSNRAWDLLKKYKIGIVSAGKQVATEQILTMISDSLAKANPDAEIINVRPKNGFYISKIIYDGKLYEIHIDDNGKIIKEEIENDEPNWSLWENDTDDKLKN